MKKGKIIISIICFIILFTIVLWITKIIPRMMAKITADNYVKQINAKLIYDDMEYFSQMGNWNVYYMSQEEHRYCISVSSEYFPTKVVYDGVHQTSMIDDKTPSNPITNTTQPNIPDTVNIVNNNISTEPIKLNQSVENVTIKIMGETLTKDGVDIIITDNNENKYAYGTDFKVQKKNGSEWVNLEYLPNTSFTDIAYQMNGNTLKLNINFKQYYGSLENGIYKLSKIVYSNGERYEIYSNEFEIK